ncbi:MAG: hypothetical protein RLY71_285 [Pseudomonadota bacterium]|jgi:NAD(P)H-dependent FMN reductase
MASSRLLVISGSARRGSLNLQLAAAASAMARQRGAEVNELDLRGRAHEAFDADGQLRDARAAAGVGQVVGQLLSLARQLDTCSPESRHE